MSILTNPQLACLWGIVGITLLGCLAVTLWIAYYYLKRLTGKD